MKMTPPAVINERITKDKFNWFMMQPNTIVIDKDKIDQELLDSLSIVVAMPPSNTVINPSGFIIDDRTKDFILFELQNILRFNGFESELLDNGSLRVSKKYWNMDLERIHDQLPFSDCFLHQIESSYKHQYENNLYSSQQVKIPRYEYSSHPYLELTKETIIDNTDSSL